MRESLELPESQNSLVDLLDRYVESAGWRIGERQYFCPICNYEKPRLTINLVSEVFYCWSCAQKGTKPAGGKVSRLLLSLNLSAAEKKSIASSLALTAPLSIPLEDKPWTQREEREFPVVEREDAELLARFGLDVSSAAELGIRRARDGIAIPDNERKPSSLAIVGDRRSLVFFSGSSTFGESFLVGGRVEIYSCRLEAAKRQIELLEQRASTLAADNFSFTSSLRRTIWQNRASSFSVVAQNKREVWGAARIAKRMLYLGIESDLVCGSTTIRCRDSRQVELEVERFAAIP